jgi:DNA-binding NtrC family response regulator
MQTKSDYPLKDIGKVFFSRVEKKMMEKALEISKWNRKKAADMLDISYKSLLNKIKEYKLN